MWWLALLPVLAGATAGAIGTWQQSEEEKASLTQQREQDWQKYLYGKAFSDQQYQTEKEEALNKAAIAQRRLNQGVSQATSEMNAGLLAQAFGIQDAQIQLESNIGDSLAAEGMSGTRGNAANTLIRAYARQGLERDIGLQKQQNALALNKMTTQATNSLADINYERDSWEAGGYRYKQKEAQDAYNLNLARLGESNFNWQIEQANPNALDYITGILGGTSSGMSAANSIYNYGKNWADSDTWANMFKKQGGA